MLIKVIGMVLTFVASLALARFLGSGGYGTYAYAISWAALVSVPAVMGLDVLATREIARFKTCRNMTAIVEFLRWSSRTVTIASFFLALTAAFLIWYFKGYLGSHSTYALLAAVPVFFLLAQVRLRQGIIQGLEKVVRAQQPQYLVLPASLLAITLLLGAFDRLSAPIAVLVHAVSMGIAVFYANRFLRLQRDNVQPTNVDEKATRIWLRSAYPLLILNSALMVNEQISVILLGSLVSQEQAGIFDIARKLAALVAFGIVAINMPLAPTIAALHLQQDFEKLQRVITKSVQSAIAIALPAALGLIFFGNWILGIFGEAFQAGYAALIVLCLGHLVTVGMGSVALLLNMTGYERDAAQGAVMAAMLNTMLSVVFIPLWGIEGAAVASVLSVVAWKTWLAIGVYSRLGIRSFVLFPLKAK